LLLFHHFSRYKIVDKDLDMPQESLENQTSQSGEASAGSLASSRVPITPEENDFFQKALEWTVTLYRPEEFRSNVKLWGSGILALSLWTLLGVLAYSHFESSRKLAFQISELTPQLENGKIGVVHQEKVQLLEKANTMVDSTSNRLYTFLTPIVTAITGYFFVSSAAKPQGGQGGSGSGGGGSAS
jgi:hypothetical protein